MSDRNDDVRRAFGDIAKQQHELRRRLEKVENAPADLRNAAIDGGKGLVQKDANGNIVYQLGTDPVTGVTAPQYRGGPVPEQPEPPHVDVGGESAKIQHSGLDVRGNPALNNFRRAHIHVSQDEDFEPSLSTLAGYMDAADGSFTHRLPGGEWYVGVVWETLSGKTSVMSDTVIADIPPLVDTGDLEDTLAAAEEKLNTYRDEVAAPRFEALETGLETNTTNLDDARTRLSEAESTLSPLPSRIETAEQDVETAKEAAVEAGAAAVEANNRAMTRLANGNFESDLLYWDHDNVSLTSTAHSGQQAALVEGWLRPGSSFPVVPEQIWELSLYHQYDVTVEFQALDGDQRATLSTHHLDGDSTWSDSGALRVTIPADVHMLSFTITGDSALVDDITLRDVTDVVRLEEAANANRQKAEQAIAEYELLKLAVDGEGGLRERLGTAETVLEDKADTSELNDLDAKLGRDLAQIEAHYSRVWRQSSPPSPGTHYAWLGEPHSSASVKLDGDGNETARNVFTRPRDFAVSGSDRSEAVDLSTPGRIEVLAGNYINAYGWALNTWTGFIDDPDFAEGEHERTYTLSVEVKANVQHPEGYYQLRFDLRTPQINYSDPGRIEDTGGEWVRISTTLTLGADLQGDRSLFNFRDGANHTPGDVIEYRDWKLERGPQATPYFDGGTPSDRANDLWYDTDGVPHEWVNGQGWTVLDDQRIRALADRVGGTEQRLEDAEEGLEEALEGPIDHDRLRVGTGAFDEAFASKLIADHATIINAAMRNLSVEEKLLFAEAVGEQIWAELGVFDRLEAREGWVGGVNLADGAVTAEKITATREMITKIMGAEWAYIAEQLIVDGSILTRDLEALSAAIQSLTVTQRADIAELWAEELWTALAVIEELQTEEAWITSAMIQELTAEKVTVTENFVGRVAELLHLVVDRIDANSLWADQTWQAAGHFGSEQADQSTLVDGTGLRITKHDTENESSTDIVRLGGEGIGLVFSDEETGDITGSLSHEGDASFRDMSADTITHGGRPLQDPDCQDYIHPSGNQSLITWRPRGIIALGERELYGIETPYRYYGFLEVPASLEAGRSYRISVTPFLARNTRTTTTRLRVFHTSNGQPPTFDDTMLINTRVRDSGSGDALVHGEVVYSPTTTGTHRFLAALYTADGVTTFSGLNSQGPVQLYVEDIGSAIPATSIIRDSYGSHPDGRNDLIGPVQTANSITTEWEATWFQNYSHDGTQKATNSNSGTGYAWNGLTQGSRVNAPSFGRYASLFGFTVSTTSTEASDSGVAIPAALAGAKPLSAYLEVQNSLAYHTRNSTNYHFYWHNHRNLTSTPAAWSAQDLIFDGSYSRFQVGQTRRVPVPLDLLEAAGKNGELAGFGMPTGPTATAWAGILSWDHKPKLVIIYER